MRRGDVDQRPLDVLGHALGVAADVDMRAARRASATTPADLAHAVLHVELLSPSRDQASDRRVSTPALRIAVEFVLVEEIVLAALVAEEQPVARRARWIACRSCRKARNGATPVPGPIMMIGVAGFSGRPKAVRLLHVGLHALRPARCARRGRSRRRRAASRGPTR